MTLPAAPHALALYPTWWLDARCACGRSALLPFKLLARQRRPGTTIAEVVARLRCQACGTPPRRVEAVDDPQADAPGYVGTAPPQRITLGQPIRE
ncbi:MAG: hypothetical protein ACOYOH_24070 [Paracraurococcus sp.]